MTPPRLPTEPEFAGWNSLPVTEVLRHFAQRKVDFIKDSWAAGSYSSSDVTVMGLKQAEMLGALRAYAEIADLTLDDILTELGEEFAPPKPEGEKE